MKRSIITGIRATGIPHIGNYLGSIKPVMEMQDEFNIYQIVADLHAIPHVKDPVTLNENVRITTACYLACGLDTEKTMIWRQSQIGETALISAILSTLTTVEEMDMLMDRKNNKNMDLISYMYPIIMAADTLIANVDYVLAGVDHEKSLEFIQHIAVRFNRQYGELLRIPKPLFPPLVEMVKGLDGKKMSKSFNNTITILETEENLHEMIMNSKLDQTINENDSRETILKLLSFFISEKEFNQIKQCVIKNEVNPREIRYLLFTNMNKELAPIRQRYNDIIKKPEYIDNVLREGLLRVKKHTLAKMQDILQKVGFYSSGCHSQKG